MQALTLDQFRTIQQTGSIQSVELKPKGSKFELVAHTLKNDVTLATSRANHTTRLFPSVAAALNVVRRLGINQVTITNLLNWQPENAKHERAARPDRKEALQRAAEYDRWFHAQVQEALDDPRTPLTSQEWDKTVQAQKEKLRQLSAS